ncbi:hypothetical protein BJX62DRAFT_140729 [Aspergillus germanicus]
MEIPAEHLGRLNPTSRLLWLFCARGRSGWLLSSSFVIWMVHGEAVVAARNSAIGRRRAAYIFGGRDRMCVSMKWANGRCLASGTVNVVCEWMMAVLAKESVYIDQVPVSHQPAPRK